MVCDYYETLGVSKEDNQDKIRHEYRKLARKYHPDVNKSPEAEALFKEIGEAYYYLGDDARKEQYDASREPKTTSPQNGTITEVSITLASTVSMMRAERMQRYCNALPTIRSCLEKTVQRGTIIEITSHAENYAKGLTEFKEPKIFNCWRTWKKIGSITYYYDGILVELSSSGVSIRASMLSTPELPYNNETKYRYAEDLGKYKEWKHKTTLNNTEELEQRLTKIIKELLDSEPKTQ
ncbi:DnaJ domain-containing protein [Candidatus Woesearchaeota archaeon]|nr:DnaJ domain-containing protein [Candidatus Woesearchaeota archaeon]